MPQWALSFSRGYTVLAAQFVSSGDRRRWARDTSEHAATGYPTPTAPTPRRRRRLPAPDPTSVSAAPSAWAAAGCPQGQGGFSVGRGCPRISAVPGRRVRGRRLGALKIQVLSSGGCAGSAPVSGLPCAWGGGWVPSSQGASGWRVPRIGAVSGVAVCVGGGWVPSSQGASGGGCPGSAAVSGRRVRGRRLGALESRYVRWRVPRIRAVSGRRVRGRRLNTLKSRCVRWRVPRIGAVSGRRVRGRRLGGLKSSCLSWPTRRRSRASGGVLNSGWVPARSSRGAVRRPAGFHSERWAAACASTTDGVPRSMVGGRP